VQLTLGHGSQAVPSVSLSHTQFVPTPEGSRIRWGTRFLCGAEDAMMLLT